MSGALYGLVLAGGQSARMGHDKALLTYYGVPQLQHSIALMASYVQKAFVSVRSEQQREPVRAMFPQIVDEGASVGPASGLLAAHRLFPEESWLVLACDLPFLDDACIAHLCAEWQKQPERSLAYRSVHDGLPEPLCAIWTSEMLRALGMYVEQGYVCPRRALLKEGIPLLDPLNTAHLENINSDEERTKIWAQIHQHPLRTSS